MAARDERRALSFGTDAATYDAARPGYPAALFDDLMAMVGPRPAVLDVGAGTGRAAIALARRGAEVVALEPDVRMAEVLDGHAQPGVRCVVTSFEDWTPTADSFDLVVSAQAWHWIDPQTGLERAHRALREDGYLAVWWNVTRRDAMPMMEQLDGVYERFAPELAASTAMQATASSSHSTDPIRSSPRFADPQVLRYRWNQPYTTAAYVALLTTHSDHRLLPAGQRQALLHGVAEVIERAGGTLVFEYETEATVARVATARAGPRREGGAP